MTSTLRGFGAEREHVLAEVLKDCLTSVLRRPCSGTRTEVRRPIRGSYGVQLEGDSGWNQSGGSDNGKMWQILNIFSKYNDKSSGWIGRGCKITGVVKVSVQVVQ